jgi:23S rRNA (guanine745-N1)-methyltransferase
MVLDVFAPRNGVEFRRILHRDGALLVVTPAADHLAELVEGFGLLRVDQDKAERVGAGLDGLFTRVSATTLRQSMRLSADEVRTLIGMTPSARHVSLDGVTTSALTVTAAVDLTTYRPRF